MDNSTLSKQYRIANRTTAIFLDNVRRGLVGRGVDVVIERDDRDNDKILAFAWLSVHDNPFAALHIRQDTLTDIVVVLHPDITHEGLPDGTIVRRPDPESDERYAALVATVEAIANVEPMQVTELRMLPTEPPMPNGADGYTWDDVFDWWYRGGKLHYPTLGDLASGIVLAPGTVRNHHSDYREANGRKPIDDSRSKFAGMFPPSQ